MIKCIVLEDINGNFCTFEIDELNTQLIDNQLTIFGMSLEAILNFKREYDSRNGKHPITGDAVKDFFYEHLKELD